MNKRTEASTKPGPDVAGVCAALIRAARAARRLSVETGTPFWVMVDGRIIDLNAAVNPRARRRRTKAHRKPR